MSRLKRLTFWGAHQDDDSHPLRRHAGSGLAPCISRWSKPSCPEPALAAAGLDFKLVQMANKLEQAFDKKDLTGYTTANSESAAKENT